MRQLGRYEIIEKLGTGAMGKVYKARDTILDRPIALKTIRTGVEVATEIRQRFYQEAKACARLQHPNIITVFDMGEIDNTAYIAMELLDGADFRRIIEERRNISVEAKIAACIGICAAISHAHRHGVTHRDIKPSNLFLTSGDRAKVLDFGIARLPSSKLTVAGQILGTPNYMAPEQILARPCDGRADLFSAAVVFFELFTYAHPFQSNFIPRRIVQGEPDSLFDGNPSLPVVLEKIFNRALTKDPDGRYQTGDELAADFQTVLDVMRGSEAPTFSHIELPSQKATRPPKVELPVAAVSTVQPPPDQDPQEWCLSEALRLLPEFEAAVEARNDAKAHSVLAELESRLAGDVRFTEAMRLCRSRMQQLDTETPAKKPVTPPPPLVREPPVVRPPEPEIPRRPPRVSPPPVEPPRVERTPPVASIVPSLDETIGNPSIGHAAQSDRQPAANSSDDSDATIPVRLPGGPVIPPFKPSVTLPPPQPRPPAPRPTPLWVPGAVIACAVIVLIVGIIYLQPVQVELTNTTAVVDVDSTNVLSEASATAGKITSVVRDTQVNVLAVPTSANQEWVRVQVVKPKAMKPGYIHTSALRDWRSKNAVDALTLVKVFSRGESGSDAEIGAEVRSLDILSQRFEGQPAAKEARLEAAGLLVSLAQRQKSSEVAADQWKVELMQAQRELEPIQDDLPYRTQASLLIRQIEELLGDEAAPRKPRHSAGIASPAQLDDRYNS